MFSRRARGRKRKTIGSAFGERFAARVLLGVQNFELPAATPCFQFMNNIGTLKRESTQGGELSNVNLEYVRAEASTAGLGAGGEN